MNKFINTNPKKKTFDEIFESIDEKMDRAIELSQKIDPSEKVQNSFWKYFKLEKKKP